MKLVQLITVGLVSLGTLAAADVSLPTDTNPATNDDITALQSFLKEYISKNNASIPVFVRAAFHDLINLDNSTNSLAAHGCLVDDPTVVAFRENAGLDHSRELVAAVRNASSTSKFTAGDILALAGKVAIETIYPCVQVEYSFGRPACTLGSEKPEGPDHSINSIKQISAFANRLRLSSEQMAVLVAGAHGLAEAKNHQEDTGVFSFTFAHENSGANFIKVTQNGTWEFFGSWLGRTDGVSPFDQEHGEGRFPSDIVFFPSAQLKLNPNAIVEPEAVQIEQVLSELSVTDASFTTRFAFEFGNMIKVGTSNLTAYSQFAANC